MSWLWVSRRTLEAAEARAKWAEDSLLRADDRLAEQMAASRTAASIQDAELVALRDERKLLIDRIVQMTGQPPIFHPAPTPAAPVAPSTPDPESSSIPAPPVRLSFDDIHRKARQAIKDGSIDKPEAVRA